MGHTLNKMLKRKLTIQLLNDNFNFRVMPHCLQCLKNVFFD